MQNGFSCLLRALQQNIPKLTVKGIFLLSNLIDGNQEHIGIQFLLINCCCNTSIVGRFRFDYEYEYDLLDLSFL